MEEPSLRTSRLALAFGLAAALLIGGAGFYLGRGSVERPATPEAPQEPSPAPTAVPTAEEDRSRVLNRRDLVALASSAADSRAAGLRPPSELLEADGRRFTIRLPFGCGAPAGAREPGPASHADAGKMGWSYDAEASTLRIEAAPQAWTAEEWGLANAGEVEALEGFWITRPWTSSEACPRPAGAVEDGAPPIAPAGETLAVGQLYTAESGRGGRRDGRPYEAVVRVSEHELDTSQGFRLRLSGRLDGGGDGSPVWCRQATELARPVCLVKVIMDEVAIENPATSETLATWTVPHPEAPQG